MDTCHVCFESVSIDLLQKKCCLKICGSCLSDWFKKSPESLRRCTICKVNIPVKIWSYRLDFSNWKNFVSSLVIYVSTRACPYCLIRYVRENRCNSTVRCLNCYREIPSETSKYSHIPGLEKMLGIMESFSNFLIKIGWSLLVTVAGYLGFTAWTLTFLLSLLAIPFIPFVAIFYVFITWE